MREDRKKEKKNIHLILKSNEKWVKKEDIEKKWKNTKKSDIDGKKDEKEE